MKSILMQAHGDLTLLVGCIMCMAICVYPLTQGEWNFIYTWDDAINFQRSTLFLPYSFKQTWLSIWEARIGVFEPLSNVIKLSQYYIFGHDARGIRLISWLFHIGTCIVLSKVAEEIIQMCSEFPHHMIRNSCRLSSLIFSMHPLNVEVYGWPSAQPYTLSLFFTSFCLLFHIIWLRSISTKDQSSRSFTSIYQIISLGMYSCAIACKSTAIPAPVGLLLLDMLRLTRHRSLREISREAITCTIWSNLCYGAVGFTAISQMVHANTDSASWYVDPLHIPLHERILKVCAVFTWTFQKYIWPKDLRAHYQIQVGEMNLMENPTCFLSHALCLICMIVVIRSMISRPWLIQSVIYFVSMHIPTIGIVQHGIITLTADRYSYFPSIVFIPLVGAGISLLFVYRPNWTSSITATLLVLSLMLSRMSSYQLNSWRNDESVWLHGIRADPSDWRATDHLATHYIQIDRYQDCRPLWLQSLLYMPTQTLKAKLQQARLLLYAGKYDEGCSIYEAQVAEFPNNVHLLNNIGICYTQRSNTAQAMVYFTQAHEFGLDLSGKKSHSKVPLSNLQLLSTWNRERNVHVELMW